MRLNQGTALVRKDSIEEVCGHRARALQLYEQAIDLIEQARAAHSRAAVGNSYISSFPHDLMRYFHEDTRERLMKHLRADVDRDVWRGLIISTPIAGLMDAEARKKFEDSLRDKPPEVTPETVFATMDQLSSDADMIFRRGLVNVFAGLYRQYRSHDGFKIGGRLILKGGVRCYDGHASLSRDEQLIDLDRVMHVLDRKPPPDHIAGLAGAIRTATQASPRLWTAETPYFRARWYENGNLHVWMKRDDLVEDANRLIAEHYGQAIGMGPGLKK